MSVQPTGCEQAYSGRHSLELGDKKANDVDQIGIAPSIMRPWIIFLWILLDLLAFFNLVFYPHSSAQQGVLRMGCDGPAGDHTFLCRLGKSKAPKWDLVGTPAASRTGILIGVGVRVSTQGESTPHLLDLAHD